MTKEQLKADIDTILGIAGVVVKFVPVPALPLIVEALREAVDNTDILDRIYDLVTKLQAGK